MKRIAPGVYADGRGRMHLVIKELLEAHGYADTPANRHTLIEAARGLLPKVPFTIVEELDVTH